MKTISKVGKVILIGAGPGDPELLTIKAMKHLEKADVILTDRLVSETIITEYANEAAEIVYVGKQCRKGNSTPQQTINELMVAHALAGKRVVRLKGGDVSVFSNILDELQTLVKYHIEYEIVPGITAALGAAAYSGIPLTARNYSTAVRFITFYKSDVISEAYWKELAQTNDTLVFYMSSETLPGIVENLVANRIGKDKLLAVVEQATTPMQQVHSTGLYEYVEKLGDKSFASPSLVIIGKVVQLHEQFKWLENSPMDGEYFKTPENKIAEENKSLRA
jgi:uroporphyrin-III C-methyltransferase/precorrin-2 dehydrogenase/sirohydrochlorin ferrochelatase/uroporphyrin-III C-methyltransferase